MTVDQFDAFGPRVQNFVNYANCPNCAPIRGLIGHTGANLFEFTHGHVETICHILTTDSTITDLYDFEFTHSSAFGYSGACASPNFFNVNPATNVDGWNISDDLFLLPGTLTTNRAILGMRLTNNDFRNTQWTITGAPGSRVSVAGNLVEFYNRINGGFYLLGGPYVDLLPGSPMRTTADRGAAAVLLSGTEEGSFDITNSRSRGTAQYVIGGGVANLVTATQPNWDRHATCRPRIGSQSVCYDPGSDQFKVVNNTNQNTSYYWTPNLVTPARR